ncbi:MAG TPA: M4 family metallopeptidase [Holophagaceae bacterium]|nr:M4 family metallopeptidase [Holophagaceae bacterium]
MTRPNRPSLTLLALAMASGALAAGGPEALPRAVLQAVRRQEPQRRSQVAEHLALVKAAWGLGPEDGLREFAHSTDPSGITHVRFHQTYRGVEVWNGNLIGHMDATGGFLPTQATVQQGISLPETPLLSSAQIEAQVTRLLSREGKLWPMRVRPIVFPTRYQEGIKFTRGKGGEFVLDVKYSVPTPAKAEPYVWAYQVGTLQARGRGLEATNFILDAQTGEVLRKWDGSQHFDAPATGTGRSQYSGTVPLSTTFQDATGQYVLMDGTRPTQPWKYLNYFPYFTEFDTVGIQTLLYDPNSWNSSGTSPFSSATNEFGDGARFDWATDYPGNLYGDHAQTAAVDAHYGIQTTWDYYAQVHGRTGGIDGLGSSPVSLIHMDDGDGNAMDNAAWVPDYFLMMYGDGSATGALTSLDVTAHEVSHGVLNYTTNLSYSAEGGGINEANSDIHAAMTKFWTWGANATGSVVPEATTTAPINDALYPWSLGSQLSASGTEPFRWMYKPSKDGLSYDAWFDGIGLDDSHFAMGPGNRFFYFLSRGASSSPSSETYSPYLPAGMTGIGNDKAIKIWYYAMDNVVTDMFADYHMVRDAVIEAAEHLYPGAGSPEVAAVKNAFAAVNIGGASGAPEPVSVVFPDMPMAREVFYRNKMIVLPTMVPVQMPAPTVSNTPDTGLVWSLGGLNFWMEGGQMSASGTFTAPNVPYGYTWPVKATSHADPKQFAVNLVWAASMDCDSDTEVDACDLGAIALDYYPYTDIYNYPSAVIYRNYFTDDLSCALFKMGFNNAFNH